MTGLLSIEHDYKCRDAIRQGVPVRAPTVISDLGLNVESRTITLNTTPLAAVNADGSPPTAAFTTSRGSFAGICISISNTDHLSFFTILAADCQPDAQKVLTAPADEVPKTSASMANGAGTRQHARGASLLRLRTGRQ